MSWLIINSSLYFASLCGENNPTKILSASIARPKQKYKLGCKCYFNFNSVGDPHNFSATEACVLQFTPLGLLGVPQHKSKVPPGATLQLQTYIFPFAKLFCYFDLINTHLGPTTHNQPCQQRNCIIKLCYNIYFMSPRGFGEVGTEHSE